MTETTEMTGFLDDEALQLVERRLDAVGEYFRRGVLTQILRDLDDVDALVSRLAQRIQREVAGQLVDQLGKGAGEGLRPSRGEALSTLAELLGKAQRYL